MILPWKKQKPESLEAVHTHTHTHVKFNKVILGVTSSIFIIVLIISIIILYRKENLQEDNLLSKEISATNKTIVEFQNERWNEIRTAVFGQSAKDTANMFNTNIASMPVVEGNEYFNWTDTSSKGITPWSGTTSSINWAHFKVGATSVTNMQTETITYNDTYEDGATSVITPVSNTITYYVVDVNTPEELRWVLDTCKTFNENVKINLLKDIDLNGQNDKTWQSINLSGTGWLYIEGNGHTICNFKNCSQDYTTGQGFFGTAYKGLIIKNLTFQSSEIITTNTNVGTIFGYSDVNHNNIGFYFYNTKVKNSFIQSNGDYVSAFYSHLPTGKNVFLKRCSVEKAYVLGKNHIAGFLSAQCTGNSDCNIKYNAEFPEYPEAFLNKNIWTESIEDCYSIDSEIFSTGGDSGGFISCGERQIVRNCFTNNIIYANSSTGVFYGRLSRYQIKGFYDDNGKQTISSYFENCYASGIIEGQTRIGGFAGYTNHSGTPETGVNVFKNCYSSSMVGMEYSGNFVGGFIGYDDDDDAAHTDETIINNKGQSISNKSSIYINCYVTGEVGDITTDTSIGANNKSTIGGFLGKYLKVKPKIVNCYYDKQTTGMKERAAGYSNDNDYGTIEGVTGVYTKGSSLTGGTPGLTGKSGNIVNLNDSDAWVLKNGLYPQLKVFESASNWTSEEAELVKCYSQASVSTIFLDHWDYIMTNDDISYNVQTDEDFTPTAKASENNAIYDTIRDITQTFEFTSKENSENTYSDIEWKVDSQMNKSRGFIEDFNIDYGEENVIGESSSTNKVLTIINPAKDKDNIDPDLLELMKQLGETKDIYKCYEFSPGKSWVKVEVKNEDGTIVGSRKLRLLPMAYVDAGNYTEITIDTDGSNHIKYTSSSGIEHEFNGEKYNHGIDTVYTTTSVENLGNYTNYNSQQVSKENTTTFAMWGRYPVEKNNGNRNTKFDALYDQKMIGDATEGLTKVAIYKLDMEYVETTIGEGQVVQVPKIDYENAQRITEADLNNEKWTGNKPFTLNDVGWYELRYYWRMDDGRYLSDSKIVVVKGSAYTAKIETEIQNQGVETKPDILPDILEKTSDPNTLKFDGKGVKVSVEEDKILKTKEIEGFTGEEILLGWKNDGNYKLVDVQIEVSQDGINWLPLKLQLNNPNNPYDFNDAKYTYLYQDYKMIQNPSTKQYYIMEINDPKEIKTQIIPIRNGDNPDYANYLHIDFQIKESEESIKSVKSHVRVNAVFVPMDTHVIAEKNVDKDNVRTGEEVTYTVLFRPDSFNKAYDINVKDIIPENTQYIDASIEVGEYDEDKKTYNKYNNYAKSNYNAENKTLSWTYDSMEYGKTYYAKFKVRATGVVDLEKQDFIKVDNVVNFTYKKSEFGKPVDGEPSRAATFIIVHEERVYLSITKEVTTAYAPKAKFNIIAKIMENGEEVDNYKWYLNYDLTENTTSTIQLENNDIAMFVGKKDLSNGTYKIKEDTGTLPQNFYFSSITGNGEGSFVEGKVNKVTVRNYYRLPEGQTNIFIEKKDIDNGEFVSGATMKIQKKSNNSWEDVCTWQTENKEKVELLTGTGEYKLIETDSPAEYNINNTEIYFTVEEGIEELLIKNSEGIYLDNHKIEFYNERKETEVVVHHYIYDRATQQYTNKKVLLEDRQEADDEVIKGKVWDDYTSKPKDNLFELYTLYETPADANGKMTIETKNINYYYIVDLADITNENITKEGNESISSKDEKINYTITYRTQIDNYIGDATVTLTDTLPYEIDTEKSLLGKNANYDKASRTITWTENITGIDTIEEGKPRDIEIIKEIEIVFSNLDTNDKSFKNIAKGKVYLNTTNQTKETEPVEKETRTNFVKDIEITKEWEHGENIYEYPEQIELQVKNKDQIVGRYTVNEGNGWKHTFTDLAKYDEDGNEIEYTADETENENLKYYRKTIEGTKVKNTYIGPIISQTKEVETEYNNTFVVQGERITYKIIVTNSGEISKDVLIKDSIPKGTTFEEGSIKVNDQEEYEGTNYSTKTREELTSTGIQVNVPGAKDGQDGTVTLSFDVTVDEDATGSILNTATVDGKETNKVEKPIVEFEKLATVERTNPESGLEGNQVTVKDIINYTIRVTNTGKVGTGRVIVKDEVPEGMQAKEIKGEGSLKGNEITWTIENIEAGQVKEVGFKAEVEYIREDGTEIENIATVGGKETNTTTNEYVKPEPSIQVSSEKNGKEKITSKTEKVSYEIECRIIVRDFNGRAKITIVDHLPYPIDKDNSNLAEGKYNPDDQTITWEEEIERIDTFTTGEAKEIIRRKTIELKFEYGNLNGTSGTMTNVVNTKIELQEPTKENPEEYETVEQKEDEAEKETLIEIPAEVLVHHYIYDEERDERTTVKIADDVLMKGLVGKDYQTEVAQVPANYECINTKPDRNKGKYEENQIVVTYYYKLIKPDVSDNIEKTATANKTNEEGVQILTKENGVVTYNIRYTVNVNKYIGKATIEIVDTLPAKLDTVAEGIDLQRGEYNEENNTITWTEEIENIDTFAEGQARNIVIEKTIKVVYKEQDVNSDLTNTVKGTTKLYYPEDKSNRPGEELTKEEATDEETVKQEYLTKLIIEKEWDDSEDRKERRPKSILVDIKTIPNNTIVERELNEENGWRYEKINIPKYDETTGEKITYEITEKEKKEKDLEFYEEPQYRNVESQNEERTTYVYTIENEYKLKETDLNTTLTKTGSTEIVTSKDIVEYTITFTADIEEYLGEGKVRIVDYLPYKIDLENSEIENGTYDDEAQTITWEEPVEHINTDLDGSKHIEITKTIKVLYKDIDLTQEKMTNNVTGKIEIFENDTKDEKETTYDTDINVNGKVIVRFVDKETGEDIVNKVVDEEGNTVEERYNYEITGKVGDEYTANEKDIQNYDYVETEGEKTGKVKEEDTEIIHYYVRSKAKVIVKYVERTTEIDEDGNEYEVLKELLPDEIINGQVFDEYTTEEKRIENYKFIFSTDNTEGEMTKEDITVIYYYEKIPSKVTVKYVERTTETDEEGNEHEVLKELLPEDVIDGYAGDEYETERKEVKNYRPAEPEPENAKGKMAEEEAEVIYYYEKIPSGILSVKYVDIDTGKTIIKIEDEGKLTPEEREKLEELLEHEDTEIEEDEETEDKDDEAGSEENNKDTYTVETYDYEITGYVGDEYATEQKEIPYYIYVKSTDNTTGELTEEGDTVIYYYRKQKFNISVNKYLDSVIVNGENIGYNNNKFMKQEVVGTMINSTNVQVTYGIEIRNTGAIDGTAKIKDTIPEGFTIEWLEEGLTAIDDRNLEAEVNLKAGESKVFKLTLNWIRNKDNFGEKTNTVSIVETSNIPGFEDSNSEDNTSEATTLLAIKTGINNKAIIAISIFILLSIIIETAYLMKTRKITLADIKKEIIRLMSK